VNKEGNNYIYSIGLPLLVSIYTSSFVFNAINFEPQGPGEGGFGPVIIFIVTSPFTIGSAITSIVSAINTRKNYNLRRWKIYVL
jgi:hypothetical protein